MARADVPLAISRELFTLLPMNPAPAGDWQSEKLRREHNENEIIKIHLVNRNGERSGIAVPGLRLANRGR